MSAELLADFDFSVLDDLGFKEDSVREELIAPIVRALGYRPSGPQRVERSKSLLHPFVMIGSTKYPIHIVPDYTLYSDSKAILVLEAKRPTEVLLNSQHAEQAYSYSIHPEIRCRNYALCNGRQFVLYRIDAAEPAMVVDVTKFEAEWERLERNLSVAALLNPVSGEFKPDLGLHLMKLGGTQQGIEFDGIWITAITRPRDDLYSAVTECQIDGVDYMGSFDFGPSLLHALIGGLPDPLQRGVTNALRHAPYVASTDAMLSARLECNVGALTKGEHDSFVPLLLTRVLNSSFNPTPPFPPDPNVPPYIYRLSKHVRVRS